MIQSFPLGTSITKIDGGNIATGTILGDRIKAGDITADRLNATSIQGSSLLISSIVNGINDGTAGSTKINGGYIETGTIAANKLIIQGGYSGCLNIDPQFQDSSVWTYSDAGSASIVTISDAPVGNKVLRSNPTFHGGDKTFYPIDINKTYRVRFWARGVGHNGFLYMCLRQYKTPSDAGLCDNNGGRAPYKPAGVSIGAGWAEYDFTWGPAEWQSGVKFVRLDWLLNYGGSAGYMEICNPRFEEAITGSLIVQGSITTDHITAAGISADVLKVGTIDVNRLNVSGIINVVNGGGTTKITGTGIATESITTSHIATAGLSADVIKTGSITSAGSGGVYQSYNYSSDTAAGFKLAHTPFTATNKWGRTQTIQAEFGTTVFVKGYPLGSALAVPLSALDFPALDQIDVDSAVFYRGNIQASTRTAPRTPNIACVTMTDFGGIQWESSADQWRFRMTIQPTALNDNLDAMRIARIKVYLAAGGDAIDTLYVPLYDRFYANPTHSDPSNAIVVDFNWFKRAGGAQGSLWSNTSPRYFCGHLLVAISNAYGWSDERWFHANGSGGYSGDSTAPAGSPPPLGGAGSVGGGGGCVPAGTMLRLAGGGLIPIEQVTPGLRVAAYDEHTLEECDARVVRLLTYHNRDMYRIVTDRGSMVCSHDHRFTRMIGVRDADYPASRKLEPNDLVLVHGTGGYKPAVVTQVMPLGYQDTVYHVQLDEGHVFVVGGFLSHNVHDKVDILDRTGQG